MVSTSTGERVNGHSGGFSSGNTCTAHMHLPTPASWHQTSHRQQWSATPGLDYQTCPPQRDEDRCRLRRHSTEPPRQAGRVRAAMLPALMACSPPRPSAPTGASPACQRPLMVATSAAAATAVAVPSCTGRPAFLLPLSWTAQKLAAVTTAPAQAPALAGSCRR